MSAVDVLLDVVRREAAAAGRPVTAWATVAAADPLTVTFPGDTEPVAMRAAQGVVPEQGDTVGMVRFGARWYVVAILEAA